MKISYLIKVENERGEYLIWKFDNLEDTIAKKEELKKSTYWKKTKSEIKITKEIISEEVLENIEI